MKYKLLKKIEGVDWEVGERKTADSHNQISTRQQYLISNLDIHNLILNGTIEKVEEVNNAEDWETVMDWGTPSKPRWRAENGGTYYITGGSSLRVIRCRDFYDGYSGVNHETGNYFETWEEAHHVAKQIKELLRKHHETK